MGSPVTWGLYSAPSSTEALVWGSSKWPYLEEGSHRCQEAETTAILDQGSLQIRGLEPLRKGGPGQRRRPKQEATMSSTWCWVWNPSVLVTQAFCPVSHVPGSQKELFFHEYGCFVCIDLCAPLLCLMPTESRRGHQIPLD